MLINWAAHMFRGFEQEEEEENKFRPILECFVNNGACCCFSDISAHSTFFKKLRKIVDSTNIYLSILQEMCRTNYSCLTFGHFWISIRFCCLKYCSKHPEF